MIEINIKSGEKSLSAIMKINIKNSIELTEVIVKLKFIQNKLMAIYAEQNKNHIFEMKGNQED